MQSGISAVMPRKEFMDRPKLLRKYIDFDEIATAPAKPYHIPCDETPDEVQDTFDYGAQRDRGVKDIDGLLTAGAQSAKASIEQRAKAIAANSGAAGKAAIAALKKSMQEGNHGAART